MNNKNRSIDIMITRRIFLESTFAFANTVLLPAQVETMESRFISLRCVNTGFKYEGVYKIGNEWLMDEFTREVGINRALWDWRQRRAHQIAPETVDIMYDVARQAGAEPCGVFNIVSGYRTRQTARNNRTSTTSLHISGRAIDFSIDGIDVPQLVSAARGMALGGVGDYARSRYPFIYVDNGRVRSW
ncbi:MAG: DUF882 domain-containing protein [Alphaproteobacteria bacterium]